MTTTNRNLASVLAEISALFTKYTVLPNEHCATVLALWAAHTWISGAFYTSPRIILSSPVPGSGKTRVLELLELVCYCATQTMNISTAALFRLIASFHEKEAMPPTLLFDETDAVFGSHPSAQAEELRGILNSSYKAGGQVIRTTGENFVPKAFPVFAPVALAGLSGHMPRTITTRAIIIEMRKRAPNEKVAPYRERRAKQEISSAVEYLREWSTTAKDQLKDAEPELPAGVEDRPAEVWEPLIAIADTAGADWGNKARAACEHFVFAPQQKPVNLGVELLADIRAVMGHGKEDKYQEIDRIRTTELLTRLQNVDESPWSSFTGGESITARRLSQLLRDFQVASVTVKDANEVYKGYVTWATAKQVGLHDAWNRYLDPVTLSQESVTPVTPVTSQVTGGKSDNRNEEVTVTDQLPLGDGNRTLSVTEPINVTENTPLTSTVTEVTGVTDFTDTVRNTDLRSVILEALSDSHPIEINQIGKQAKAITGSAKGLLPQFDRLIDEGLISEIEPGKFIKKKAA